MTDNDLQIFPMTVFDIPFILDIEKKCFSDLCLDSILKSSFENPSYIGFIAFLNKIVVGYIFLTCIENEADIISIGVLPAFRRIGIGSLLMSKVCDFFNENNVIKASLDVRSKNLEAQNLYKRFGFEQVGIRKKYYKNPIDDGLILLWNKEKMEKCNYYEYIGN